MNRQHPWPHAMGNRILISITVFEIWGDCQNLLDDPRILPRCGTLMFTSASLRLLTKWSCFFDNRLAPPTRYKRECSNKLVLLNMDCGLFYFDELVTYYAVSCSSDPVVLRWRDSRCAFANLLLARLYIYSGRPLNFPVFIFANVKVILFCWFYCYNFYHADFDRKLIE